MPTVLDGQTKSLSDKVDGEVDESRGDAEHTDDTRVDPDFVPNKDTPVGDNQVKLLPSNASEHSDPHTEKPQCQHILPTKLEQRDPPTP